ncbi:sulfatase [Roseiconus nitratireducens]|uniref:Sulfatase n=1 Tax=Roseiconus nitratireducens TaxID=2605748 RepID=A0A5M6DGH9_9BACT|nr:sulfatase [Roseiconus nitratireducens]KAA5545309.1 sulfatase [Roseiconus nitratireducens]
MSRLFSRFLLAILLVLGAVEVLPAAQASAERPNIVLIFVDDLGWKDVGCYGNEFVETPNIDQLAAEGVRFTNFYASGAVCSPTRCALQSGQNQARIGITAHIPGHWRPFERVQTPRPTNAMPSETVTVAESLKQAGYTTGYIGKWHLGSGELFSPGGQGYDFDAEINGPHFEGKYRARRKDLKPKAGQYRTEFETDLARGFIQRSSEKPFFLMISPFAVHIPLGAMSSKVEKYRAKAGDNPDTHLPHPIYAAMIEHVDDMVGRIMDQLRQSGLDRNTMVVFTSDNGGLYRRYDFNPEADRSVSVQKPLRGEKGTLFEGGIRVPLIIRYPGVAAQGKVCDEPTITHDFYPTFVELAGGSLPENQPIDGVNLLPLIRDPQGSLGREALYWHYPHYHHDRPSSAIRQGDWKLIEYIDGTGQTLLFNLADDLGETTDLSQSNPGRTQQLRQQLSRWRNSVVARMPIPNPHYDPDRAGEWWSVRTGKPIDSQARKRFPATEKDL